MWRCQSSVTDSTIVRHAKVIVSHILQWPTARLRCGCSLDCLIQSSVLAHYFAISHVAVIQTSTWCKCSKIVCIRSYRTILNDTIYINQSVDLASHMLPWSAAQIGAGVHEIPPWFKYYRTIIWLWSRKSSINPMVSGPQSGYVHDFSTKACLDSYHRYMEDIQILTVCRT